ncbi:MAG TPA: DsbE family thiol:disulfide interchange protein [Pseudomonadales bacterium]|nr:DsbE family thiol:disulfide interchange protein [Pseudomonadales bacterium]
MSRASLFVPLAAFIVIAGLLYAGFSLNDPHVLPSALIGKPFPAFDLPALDDGADARRFSAADVRGPALVNVWATWCPTCRAEHEELLRIHRETGLPIIGVNYKDDSAQARDWLRRLGNPYVFNIVDATGSLGVDLGVYGAPETFLVDASGTIVYKRVGDVNPAVWEREIKPQVDALKAGPARG